MVYVVAIAILFSFALKHKFTSVCGFNDKRKYISFAVLVCIASFAYMLGSDTPEYVYFYNHLVPIEELRANIVEQYRYQPGFVVFCSAIKAVSDNYLVYQIFHALVVNIAIFRFCGKYSCNPYISLLAYVLINYLEFNFEIQRESLAVVCGLLFYEFYDKRKFLGSALFFVLAYFFHFSAIAILLIPFLICINPSNCNIFVVSFLSALAPWAWKVLPNAEAFLALSTDSEFYANYINQELNINYNIYYYLSFYVMNMGLPIVIIWVSKAKKPFYTNMVLIYVLFKMLSLFSYGFYRFSNYFVCFYWIALADTLPLICKNYKLNKSAVYLFILSIVCYTNQTKMTWFDSETGKYIYQRYFPYESVVFDDKSYIKR